MFEKRPNNFKSPDLTKLQEVVIDEKTKIYVAVGSDPEEAKKRFLSKLGVKYNKYLGTKKTVIP